MTITIPIAEGTEVALRRTAAERGQDVGEFVGELIERAYAAPATSRPTFAELTAPIADAIRPAGMTDDEIGDFFAEVVREVRAERRAAKKSPP